MDPKLTRQVFARTLVTLIVMLSGTLGVALNIPWSEVFSPATPGGGDIPAHPVLMQSVKDALLNHFSIIHYCYRFWGGFELFQSYFPLPYLFGAVISPVVGMNIAFKLTSILGILATPLAFAYVARKGNLCLTGQFFASILGVNFLYTEAHTIWGGNVLSTMAGSIGHCWSFPLFLFSFGALLKSRESGAFSAFGAIAGALAIASHFYALLMLFVLFLLFLTEDLIKLSTRRTTMAQVLPVHLTGIASVLLMAWWILPLLVYRSYTSEFGGDWEVSLLKTLRWEEQLFFGGTIILSIALQIPRATRSPLLRTTLLFLSLYALLFAFCTYLGSTAFNNVRIWPSLYLAFHLLAVATVGTLTRLSHLLTPVFATFIWLVLPPDDAFLKAGTWMKWNFEGIEHRLAWNEFSQIVSTLNRFPPSRITFEAGLENNRRLGSGRTFEMLPYFTHHDILEGGIVGSATWPGIGYAIQCLASPVCAGWPPGSIVATNDIPRAIATMRTFGVEFHITSSEENKDLFKLSPLAELLYEGRFFALFRLRGGGKLVEVFSEQPPVIKVQKPNLFLLNQYRFDALRDSLFVFDDSGTTNGASSDLADPSALLNYLQQEWYSLRRTTDRGAEPRVANGIRYLNTFFFSQQRTFDLDRELAQGASIYIADQTFSPWTVVAPQQEKYSEVALPLLRDEAGSAMITIYSGGYRAFLGSTELNASGENTIEFAPAAVAGETALFQLIKFLPDDHTKYRYIDVFTRDFLVRPGLPGGSEIKRVSAITESCQPQLLRSYEELVLKTKCPGKPHLVKFMYYPKWKANVVIRKGSHGFMELTPTSEFTVLRHTPQLVDLLSLIVSWAVGLLLVLWSIIRNLGISRRHPSKQANAGTIT